MRMPARLSVLGLLLLAGAMACVGEDADVNRATAPAAASDGGTTDGTTESGGPTDASSTGESIVTRGDFESSGCPGWKANEAILASDPDKHGGARACRVCASGGTSVWGIFQNVDGVAAGGYAGRAFLRATGDAGPPIAVLRLETSADSREGEATLVPGEGWQEVKAEIEAQPGTSVGLALLSQSAGGCFLVDDVTLVKR